jgi:hypothetical protein
VAGGPTKNLATHHPHLAVYCFLLLRKKYVAEKCVFIGSVHTGTIHEKMRNKTNSVALEEKMRKKKN